MASSSGNGDWLWGLESNQDPKCPAQSHALSPLSHTKPEAAYSQRRGQMIAAVTVGRGKQRLNQNFWRISASYHRPLWPQRLAFGPSHAQFHSIPSWLRKAFGANPSPILHQLKQKKCPIHSNCCSESKPHPPGQQHPPTSLRAGRDFSGWGLVGAALLLHAPSATVAPPGATYCCVPAEIRISRRGWSCKHACLSLLPTAGGSVV